MSFALPTASRSGAAGLGAGPRGRGGRAAHLEIPAEPSAGACEECGPTGPGGPLDPVPVAVWGWSKGFTHPGGLILSRGQSPGPTEPAPRRHAVRGRSGGHPEPRTEPGSPEAEGDPRGLFSVLKNFSLGLSHQFQDSLSSAEETEASHWAPQFPPGPRGGRPCVCPPESTSPLPASSQSP